MHRDHACQRVTKIARSPAAHGAYPQRRAGSAGRYSSGAERCRAGRLAEFDPAELLAPYTGDIVAEGISKTLRGGATFLCRTVQRQQRYVAEAITEEWRMAPGPLEVAWFAEETAAVERAVDSLAKRLEKLEAK